MSEIEGLKRDMRLAAAAEDALQNEAVVAYFDAVEQRSIDALLDVDALDDVKRLRLTIVAQTIRKLKAYLHDARDMGAYAEEVIGRISREDGANGA